MKKLSLILLLCTFILTSCATIFTGSKDKVIFHSDKINQPVDLTIDSRKHRQVTLPYQVKVRKGFKKTTVVAESTGYKTCSLDVNKKFNPVAIVNLTNILAWGIDAATGAMMKPEYKEYYFDFRPDEAYMTPVAPVQESRDTTIPAGESQKVVNRDAPGQTALERTIIRWYFDSEPRGARLFWRVISSIPDQVKNTNETYLMSTPYEETRSFNILGLTYENSRDVQIEVKCVKNGYYEQVKRFNVRQAIDQQEISSFFELVPRTE